MKASEEGEDPGGLTRIPRSRTRADSSLMLPAVVCQTISWARSSMPAAPNASVIAPSVGNSSVAMRTASGKYRAQGMRGPVASNVPRTMTGPPGRTTRRSSAAQAGRSSALR